MTQPRETQVLVIGGSLIGLTSSLLLSSLGIEHVLVDRRPHTSDHPRARLYDRRTMELLRRFGVHREVEATGIGDLWTRQNRWIHSLTGPQIAKVPTESFQMASVDYSPSMPVMGAQDLIEETLWKAARVQPTADVRFHTIAEDLEQDADGCSANLRDRDTDQVEQIRARYVVAADGVNSATRELIGCPLDGPTFDVYMQDILFQADLSRWVGNRVGGLLFMLTRYGMGVYQPMDGALRWRVQLPNWDPERGDLPVETARDYIVEAVGVDASELDLEIQSIRPWRFIAGLSKHFSNGRIFLAGDAAHAFIPTGGMGSNTGFSGAHNLIWKLAYTLQGHAPATLLDTYEQEHRPVAEHRVALSIENGQLAANIVRTYMSGGDMAEAERNCHQYGSYEGMIMAYEYESPLCQAETEPPPAVENEHRDFVPVVRGGRRAPHAWLDPHRTVSTLDWFGADYVVMLCPGDQAVQADWRSAVDARRARGFPIRVEPMRHAANTPYADSQAVVVRPDGVVAAHTAADDPRSPTEVLDRYLTTSSAS
ncbi:MAG: FAD-dependent monooxygenase [Chloroflexota bacterium]|nr:FAD-dependent monooxygenase [Chloroflexota bacterium]MDE2894558.1 FAD-dependent monooxygenase [Chloroflexota bacterium]